MSTSSGPRRSETQEEVATPFTVLERWAISEELEAAGQRWLSEHGIIDEVDESWLEIVCEDGDTFTREKLLLHLAVPPCEVSPGDSIDVGRTRTVGRLWPGPGASKDEVPQDLALARTVERRDDIWVAKCELPGPVRELFTVERPAAMLSVMNATRRTLVGGAMSISGDPDGRLTFTAVADNIVVRGSTEARVPEDFTYWLDAGPAMGLAAPLEAASRVVGSLGGLSDLIIINDQGVEARCFLDGERPALVALAEDYFEQDAQGRVEGMRIDRQGGLGREALVAIASHRPRDVTFTLTADGGLVISGDSEGDDPFELDASGLAAFEDQPGTPIVVPYLVALAIHDGAKGGIVELTVDARWGRVHRHDQGITVEWSR